MSDKTSKIKNKKEPTAELPKLEDAFALDDFESGYTSEKKLPEDSSHELKRLASDVEALQAEGPKESAEARDLASQQKHYQEFVEQVSAQVEELRHQNEELLQDLEAQRRTNSLLSQEIEKQKKGYDERCTILKNDYEEKIQQASLLSGQLHELSRSKDEFKEKVKEDLKRIKLKERELENKYELLKRDSQTLLDSKDHHILELRKKNDALDLELESLEEKLRGASRLLNGVSVKKKRLIETMRLAISLLEEIDSEGLPSHEQKLKAG